jgi:hypothetical protein
MYLVTGNTIPGFTPHPNPTTRPGDSLPLQLLMMTFLHGWEQFPVLFQFQSQVY